MRQNDSANILILFICKGQNKAGTGVKHNINQIYKVACKNSRYQVHHAEGQAADPYPVWIAKTSVHAVAEDHLFDKRADDTCLTQEI